MNLAVATASAPARRKRTALAAPTAIIIIGLDDRRRPHASRFPIGDDVRVDAAAAMMGMTTLRVEGPALAEMADKLPVGKLFASGKAFVPFVGQQLYQRLEAYLPIAPRIDPALMAANKAKKSASAPTASGEGQSDYAAAKATKTPRSGKYPEDWDKIVAGHIVLASAERDDGWWTAHVREVRADGTYLLEWEEWKGFAKFVCRREQIALLHPDYDGQ